MTLEKIPCLTALYLLLSLPFGERGPPCGEREEASFVDSSVAFICPSVSFSSPIFFSCSKFDEQAHHGRGVSKFTAVLGSKKIPREQRFLVLRSLTIKTGIVRPFTEAEHELRDRLGRIIINVGEHGHLQVVLVLKSCCLVPDAAIFRHFVCGHVGTLETKYRSTVPRTPLSQNAPHRRL